MTPVAAPLPSLAYLDPEGAPRIEGTRYKVGFIARYV